MSSARAAELHMVREHRILPTLRTREAAARLEKHGQSMRVSERADAHFDGHVLCNVARIMACG